MSFSCSQRYNHPIYRAPFTHCNGFKYSFSSNIIILWNNLPLEAVNSETLHIFNALVAAAEGRPMLKAVKSTSIVGVDMAIRGYF